MSWLAGLLSATVILLALNHHLYVALAIAAGAAVIARMKGGTE